MGNARFDSGRPREKCLTGIRAQKGTPMSTPRLSLTAFILLFVLTLVGVTSASAQSLTSVTLSSSTVASGSSVIGTLTLSGPATVGAAPVQLASSNPGVASVPTSVTFVPGATQQ